MRPTFPGQSSVVPRDGAANWLAGCFCASLVPQSDRRFSAVSENQSADNQLVSGRECGRCTVCCKALKIDVPELKKLAAVLCEHCTEGIGCKIYETRPSVCKGWYCGWRRMRYLGDDWRPDRCGVLIDVIGKGQGIPARFPQIGLKFDVVDSPRVLNWDPLIRFIGLQIERGIPVFLGVPAAVGYERRKVFLNSLMAQAVASHDRTLMIKGLVTAFEMGVIDGLTEKTTFE
jgi:hypothetical protein